jgi:hypothetical protein
MTDAEKIKIAMARLQTAQELVAGLKLDLAELVGERVAARIGGDEPLRAARGHEFRLDEPPNRDVIRKAATEMRDRFPGLWRAPFDVQHTNPSATMRYLVVAQPLHVLDLIDEIDHCRELIADLEARHAPVVAWSPPFDGAVAECRSEGRPPSRIELAGQSNAPPPLERMNPTLEEPQCTCPVARCVSVLGHSPGCAFFDESQRCAVCRGNRVTCGHFVGGGAG